MLSDDFARRPPADPFAELVAADPGLVRLARLGRRPPAAPLPGLTALVLAGVVVWWVALGPVGAVLATLLSTAVLLATAAALPADLPRVAGLARRALAGVVLLAAGVTVLAGPGLDRAGGPVLDAGPAPVLVATADAEALRRPVEEALGGVDDRGTRWTRAARSGTPLTDHVAVTDSSPGGWFAVTVDGAPGCVRITPGSEKVRTTCPGTVLLDGTD